MSIRTPEEHRAIIDKIAETQRQASAKNKANVTHKQRKLRGKRGSVRAKAKAKAAQQTNKQRFYDVSRYTARDKWEEL